MSRIKETTVYKYSELSEDAKEKAREWWSEIGLDYDWFDSVFEDAKAIGAIIGIDIDKIYFSGFWSQGDGACFVGSYHYAKESVKKLKEYAPQDTELHRIVTELAAVQKTRFYQLTATIKHTGHYSHSRSTDIDVADYRTGNDTDTEADNAIKELLRDFMNWIYRILEKEYEYLTSDEQVAETMAANEFEFTKDGKRA
jgi:hypothetical protein